MLQIETNRQPAPPPSTSRYLLSADFTYGLVPPGRIL